MPRQPIAEVCERVRELDAAYKAWDTAWAAYWRAYATVGECPCVRRLRRACNRARARYDALVSEGEG